MRLWHYKLLSVLPDKMLVSQWRECVAIKRQWEKGTLKHRLVSYVKNYQGDYFITYVRMVVEELDKRDIKYQNNLYQEIINWCCQLEVTDSITCGNIYPEHNDQYLRECLYNLEEKAVRGIITKEEWMKIYNEFKDFADLWNGD